MNFPRRNCVDKMSLAELAIRQAIQAVEEVGADTRLTDAVVLLAKAQNRVADFVDGVKPETTMNRIGELERELAEARRALGEAKR